MLPDHKYPIPQREPLIRIIRNRRIHRGMADCTTPGSQQPSYGCRSAYSKDQELERQGEAAVCFEPVDARIQYLSRRTRS
jgi:hypothetical protein